MDFPILRFELEGVKRSIAHAFNQSNEELNKMVQDTIESQLTEKWVQSEINQAVKSCIKSAIVDVANNSNLKSAITKMIVESIKKPISK